MGIKSHKFSVRKVKKTKKQKRAEKRVHRNKYEHLVPVRIFDYDPIDKKYRTLPLPSKPGEVYGKGYIVIHHGRRYSLRYEVTIPKNGIANGDFILVGSVK